MLNMYIDFLLILKFGFTGKKSEVVNQWLPDRPDVHLCCLPEHVVDGDDILFVYILSVANDGGARL